MRQKNRTTAPLSRSDKSPQAYFAPGCRDPFPARDLSVADLRDLILQRRGRKRRRRKEDDFERRRRREMKAWRPSPSRDTTGARDWVGSPTILSPRRSSRFNQGLLTIGQQTSPPVKWATKRSLARDGFEKHSSHWYNERDRRASGTIIRTSNDRGSLPCVRSYGCDKSTLSRNYSRIGRTSSDVRARTNHARLISPVPGYHLCPPDSYEPFVCLFFSRRAWWTADV